MFSNHSHWEVYSSPAIMRAVHEVLHIKLLLASIALCDLRYILYTEN